MAKIIPLRRLNHSEKLGNPFERYKVQEEELKKPKPAPSNREQLLEAIPTSEQREKLRSKLSAEQLWKIDRELLDAVQEGNLDKTIDCLIRGADPNVRDDMGETPLLIAAEYDYLDLFKLLLEAGADPRKTFVVKAATRGYVEALRIVYNHFPTRLNRTLWELAINRVIKFNEAEFHRAASQPSSPLMGALLNNLGIEELDLEEDRELSTAAENGDTKSVKALLEKAANPNVRMFGKTPLFWAVFWGDFQMVEDLIRAGADPFIPPIDYMDGKPPEFRDVKEYAEVIGYLGIVSTIDRVYNEMQEVIPNGKDNPS